MRKRMDFRVNRCLALLCMATLCVFLPGCRKEQGAMRFTLFTETMGGSSKVVVDGLTSSWRSGDQVWVNGVTGTVALDDAGDPKLTVNVDNWDGNYYAAYPASMVTGSGQNSVLSVTLPQAYQYREDATTHQQLLEMPMVACTGNDRITFKHLTGALVVQVPHAENNIVLDYVMVQSSTSALSGTGTVNAGADSPQVTFGADTTHTVVMYFDECPVVIQSNASTTKDIMIPIAPTTGEGHRFTVTVCAHTRNGLLQYYLYNNKSRSGNISRNEVAVAPVPNLPQGVFVGDGNSTTPYLIQNKEDYKRFLKYVSINEVNDKCFSLVNDIDFYGDTIVLVVTQNVIRKFYGKFNGNGKRLKNVSVQGFTTVDQGVSRHYLSLFPALSGGVVRNLYISEVNLLSPQGGNLRTVYAGGFTFHVEAYSDGVLLENIQVSNISFGYPSTSPSTSNVVMGGIVGNLIENTAGSLTMSSCRFDQPATKEYYISSKASTLYWGGLIGMADDADVTLAEFQVGFGGSQQTTGTTVNSSASTLNYAGGAIVKSTNNTIQISTSLQLKGHIRVYCTADKYAWPR